uniref:Quinolinate synthase n=1 Tax=Fervidobacterium pennivorans TaxID=93466 RepID=A0A7C4W774_FERPE
MLKSAVSVRPEDIRKLADEKGYVIVAHNYQIPELQEIADYLGDSLQLARMVTKIDAKKILFLGVDFMAEVIKVLNPEKKIIVPVRHSTCPMANSLTVEDVIKFKEKYNAPFVVYVNSRTEVKAYADVVCTSANAVDVVKAIDSDTILFGPDKNLASYVAEKTGKNIIPIPGETGYCYVHNYVKEEEIKKLIAQHPDAEIMAHPEVPKNIRDLAHFVGSTSQMEKYPAKSQATRFIVVTEIGMIAKLKKLYPEREFIPVTGMVCYNMKKNNLKNTYLSLLEESVEVLVDEEIAKKAKIAIERMLEITESKEVKR